MKKLKHRGCIIEILVTVILIAVGFATTTETFDIIPLWLQIIILIIIGRVAKIKDRVNPYKRFENKVNKARKSKDRNKTIELLEDALNIDHISEMDRTDVIEKLAELYLEIGESNKSSYYYNRAIEALKTDLEYTSLSEIDRIEMLWRLSEYSFKVNKYGQAAYYLDKFIRLGIDNKNIYLESEPLMQLMKIYIASNQKQKAITYYETLLKREKCKRNEEIEQLLC